MVENKVLNCGLIMPISSIDGCSTEHWADVKSIISEAIKSITQYEFTVNLVSDADDIGVIQKRIVQNVYNSDIIVCDVSGKNPNVMFELGLRLAFDKAAIIVKDDKTDYSFDTGIIEHVTYPRDLRFTQIISFKEKLAEKTLATYKKSVSDPEHSTFLKNFGQFRVANLTEEVVSPDKLIIEMLKEMQNEISFLRRRSNIDLQNRPRIHSVYLQMIDYIKSWTVKNECDVSSLMGCKEFYDYVEQEMDALNIFDTKDQFINELNRQILKCSA